MLREFCIILLLTVIGIAYSLVGGLSPLPGVEPGLEAGEIHLADAQALTQFGSMRGGLKNLKKAISLAHSFSMRVTGIQDY